MTKDDKEDPVLWHLGYKLGLYWVLKSKGKIRREKHHYYYYPILLDLTISFLPFPRIFLKNCFFSLTFNQVKMTSLCLLSHFLYIPNLHLNWNVWTASWLVLHCTIFQSLQFHNILLSRSWTENYFNLLKKPIFSWSLSYSNKNSTSDFIFRKNKNK